MNVSNASEMASGRKKEERSHGSSDGERGNHCRKCGTWVGKIVDGPARVERCAATAGYVGAAADCQKTKVVGEGREHACDERRVHNDVAIDEHDHVAGDSGCSRSETAEEINEAHFFMGEMTTQDGATSSCIPH